MLVGALIVAWLATFAYALRLLCRLREHRDAIARLADVADEGMRELEDFKVGDRVDVDVDDVPLLTETAVHRIADRFKDTSRWARSD